MSFRLRLGTFAVLAAISSAAQGGTVIHVDDNNCPAPGSGTQDDPYCYILLAILSAVDGDEIVVQPGTYVDNISFFGKAITVRSADPTDPAVVAATIIQAALPDSVVICNNGEGPDTVLSGFVIAGGTATFLHLGGGMYNKDTSPTVTHCTFSGNTAPEGGGMHNEHSSPTMIECTFYGNTAEERGGGIYNASNIQGEPSNPALTNCTFLENTAVEGGGIYNEDGDHTLNGCSFSGNSAMFGGGLYHDHGGVTVIGCTFTGNIGGGLRAGFATVIDCTFSGGGMVATVTTVTNCTFKANSRGLSCAGSGIVSNCTFSGNIGGGGLLSSFGTLTVIDCRFNENVAQLGGAGIFKGSDTTVINCTFTGNSANTGGGIHSWAGPTTVINCTFIGNSAQVGGGSVYSLGGSPTVTNSILWSNSPDEIAGGGTPVVTYSDVQGGWPGTGNIDADPLLVDPGGGDLRLQPGSPCIDAGNNAAVPALITTDLGGEPRFSEDPETPDTGDGEAPIVDMGAYEYRCSWDCDGSADGSVNVSDLLALLAQFDAGSPIDCTGGTCDYNVDGCVDAVDLLNLLAHYNTDPVGGTGCPR